MSLLAMVAVAAFAGLVVVALFATVMACALVVGHQDGSPS